MGLWLFVTNTLADGLMEWISPMLDEVASKTVHTEGDADK